MLKAQIVDNKKKVSSSCPLTLKATIRQDKQYTIFVEQDSTIAPEKGKKRIITFFPQWILVLVFFGF